MSKALGNSWIVIVVSAAMLLVVAAACSAETVEVPGETVVVEKEVVKEVMVPGETVVQEVVKEVMVPGETIVVKEEVVKEVMVPGETVVVEKVVTETVEVPGETVTVEVVKEVQVPGETVVVEKEVVKTVEVPGETVVVEKVVTQTVEVPGQTVVVEKEVVKEVMVPGETVVVEKVVVQEVVKEVVKEVEVPAMSMGPQGALNVGFPDMVGRYGTHPVVTDSNSTGLSHMAAGEALSYTDINNVDLPQLAKSWSISSDSLVWTFQLEEGVQFHRGYGEMTADDVIFSIEELAAEDSLDPGVTRYRRLWAAPDGWVKALDDYTIEVNTGTFQFDMLFTLSFGKGVFSKTQVEELGAELASQEGALTGSWELAEQRPGYWKFDAVEDHWRQTPHFAELVFWNMPEEATRVANFQVGRLDTMKFEFDSFETIKEVPGVKFMRVDGAAIEHAALMGQWYTDPELLASTCSEAWISCDPDINSAEWENARKLREALAISFDRQLIVDSFVGGEGRPTIQWGWELPNARANLEPDIVPWPFDPERAKQLMVEAGYPDGFDITVTTAIRGVPGEVDACEYMASAWNEIGINATIYQVPYPSLVEELTSFKYVGAECHGTSARAHPAFIWGAMLSSSRAPWWGAWHPVLDEIIPKVTSEPDEAKRWALSNDVMRFNYENVLEFGTYSTNVLFPVGPRVEEWYGHLRGLLSWPSRFEYAEHRK